MRKHQRPGGAALYLASPSISQYMSAVAQPDEEPPYPVRTALKRCLGASTDTLLAGRVEAYVAANPGISNAPYCVARDTVK
jgi:hypothetical protein